MTETIIVQPVVNQVTVSSAVPTVTVTAPGPQGPTGPAGPAAAVFYTHTQASPATVWTVNHNLNGYPAVVVFDSANNQCEGSISYTGTNTLTLTFTAAFSGVAYII
jgi:hypothetical protein